MCSPLCIFSTSELPKVCQDTGIWCSFTWKCSSRHSGVHVFDIGTSKSGPTLTCFATATCDFSRSELQKVVRTCRVLYIFTWKWASRHSGVQFLISPAFRDFSSIWRRWIFFLLTFALLHLRSSDFTSSHLLFNSPHCRKFAIFKLPSI